METVSAPDILGDVVLAVTGHRCRCGHEWIARFQGERPRVCPKCKSANWDRPYRRHRPLDEKPPEQGSKAIADALWPMP